jgi:hypothetical protein
VVGGSCIIWREALLFEAWRMEQVIGIGLISYYWSLGEQILNAQIHHLLNN